MKVRTFGFIWEPRSGKGVDEFLECVRVDFSSQMAQLGIGDFEHEDIKRLIAVSRFGDIWAGVLLTIKNAKKFIKSQRSEDGLKVTTQNLEENSQIADVNLFTINPKNRSGLYQFYQGSAHISAFGKHCDSLYHRYSAEMNRAATLRQALYLNSVDYPSRIEMLKSVNNIEYEFITFQADNEGMTPADGYVKRQKLKVFYDYRNTEPGLISEIADYAKRLMPKLLRFNIEGRDVEDNEVTYRLDQPSVFSEMEFDDFQIDFELKHEDAETALQSSHSIRELLKLTNQPGITEFFNRPEVKE